MPSRLCARLCDWRYACVISIKVSDFKSQATATPVVTPPGLECGSPQRLVRAAGVLFFTSVLALPVLAQEQAGHKATGEFDESPPTAGSGGMLFWKWANFALLAGGLTYLIRKNALPYFAKRSSGIRKSIIEAEEFRAEAGFKVAATDRRLAGLGLEIEALRRDAQREREAQAQRVSP